LSNSTANENSFFGYEAGMSTTLAGGNSFFGANSGRSNTTGQFNSFFGRNSGYSNVDTGNNSFFGWNAGAANTGEQNSFFGSQTGQSNTTGGANSFFGEEAGKDNTTGSRNTFLGRWAGSSNTTGVDNIFIGFNAGLLNQTGSNNIFIGKFSGTFDEGNNITLIGSNTGVPNGLTLQYATALGADAEVSTSNTVQLGRANGFETVFVPGLIRVNGLGLAGSTNLCRNASNQIATCSSSLRYKTKIQTFGGGLDIVRRLRPITFKWIDGGLNDLGFGAEEVNAVEPLLTTRNEKGEIEGVKYAQISTVLVNAVNEQQTEIEELKEQIKLQQQQIEALKKLVCKQNPAAEICREK
jgi:trimeric autotransporter adhesin